MNQQEKELLLKDLCSRHPYGVKVVAVNNDHNDDQDNYAEVYEEMDYINHRINELVVNGYEFGIDQVKPCLFPLRSMIQPITLGNRTFIPLNELREISDHPLIWVNSKHNIVNNKLEKFGGLPLTIIEKLQEWHINFRLPDHLFVPVTETFNPYKS